MALLIIPLLICFKLTLSVTASSPLSPETIIEAPSPTNWGDWGPLETCPNGTFVTGMQLKTHESQGPFGEDTALNGLKFFCSNFNKTYDRDNETLTEISSSSHSWGKWGKRFMCHNDFQIATGFQMRFEKFGGWYIDDTAGNNVRLFCNGGKNVLEGDGTSWGEWTRVQMCPAKTAFCGISTQVYVNGGTDDQTAMDSARVKCCDVPNPAAICVPSDSWDLVIECDNLEAISPTTCTYQKKVGMSNYTSTSESHWDLVNTYTDIGFSLEGIAGQLLLNFQANLDVSTSTGYNWTSSSSEMWSEEVTTTVAFEVPSKVKSQLFQIYGSCGIYSARATRFKKVDIQSLENGLYNQSVSIFDE